MKLTSLEAYYFGRYPTVLDADIKHLEDSLAAAKKAKAARTGEAEANVCRECGEVFDDADLYKHMKAHGTLEEWLKQKVVTQFTYENNQE